MEANNTNRRYIDRYKFMAGKESVGTGYTYQCAPDDVIEDAIKLLSINPSYLMAIKLTESAAIFYQACKDIKSLIPQEYQEDVFYAIRSGNRLKGVPAKLTTLLNKAKSMHNYPNVALSMIPEEELSVFSQAGILPEGITITDVVCNVWGSDVKVMSPYRKRVEHLKDVEVYVENKIENGKVSLFDTVVIMPKDISDTLQDRDVANVVYDTERGIILGDTILRKVNGRFAITKSYIDMRGVF